MLDKATCQRCYRERGWKWDDDEEEMWLQARGVCCPPRKDLGGTPPSQVEIVRSIESDPSTGCDYFMEQLIVSQANTRYQDEEWLSELVERMDNDDGQESMQVLLGESGTPRTVDG